RRATVRARLGLTGTEPMVVYVGRVAPEKCLNVALRAWPDVTAATRATLVVVGDGPLAERYRAAHADARVIWRPFENDRCRLAEILAAADVFLAPGPIETFGLAALEALACGTPVLSVGVGGVAELVRRSGAGALYDIGSSTHLATTLTRLLASDL